MDGRHRGAPRAPGEGPVQYNKASSAMNRGASPGVAVCRFTLPACHWGPAKRKGTAFYPSFDPSHVLDIDTSDGSVRELAHHYGISRQSFSMIGHGKRWSSLTQAQDRTS
jgi:hypothetical protein